MLDRPSHALTGRGRARSSPSFTDVEITETQRVHEHAGSPIIRARKP